MQISMNKTTSWISATYMVQERVIFFLRFLEIQTMEDTIILTQTEVKECLSMNEAIDAVKVAYSAFAKGRVQMPSVQHLDVHKHNGEVDIKSGFVEDFGLIITLEECCSWQFFNG